MKETLKIIAIYFVRFALRLLFVFPIKENRICFIAFGGRGYTCNPKYIYQKCLETYGDKMDYVWLLRDGKRREDFSKATKIAKCNTLKYFFYLATSKYIITNFSMLIRPPKRRQQIYINTWHGGGAYKKVGVVNLTKEKRRAELSFKILAKETDIFISSSKIFTDIMSDSMKMKKDKFLEIGMPRNDIFFKESKEVTEKVRSVLKIQNDEKIVLYAPTYRGESGNLAENAQLDVNKILSALEDRFGSNFVCVYRGHYYIHNKTLENTINASDYPDMQELLCAADVLITDYSSSMWDFSLTGKPCFLFIDDIKEYSHEREFYTPIEEWGFPFAATNDSLREKIMEFNQEEYINAVKNNHNYFGSFERGTACNTLIDLLQIKN